MHVKWLHITPRILQDYLNTFVLWDEIFTLIKHHALILINAYTASNIFFLISIQIVQERRNL